MVRHAKRFPRSLTDSLQRGDAENANQFCVPPRSLSALSVSALKRIYQAWNMADRAPELTPGARIGIAFQLEEDPTPPPEATPLVRHPKRFPRSLTDSLQRGDAENAEQANFNSEFLRVLSAPSASKR